MDACREYLNQKDKQLAANQAMLDFIAKHPKPADLTPTQFAECKRLIARCEVATNPVD